MKTNKNNPKSPDWQTQFESWKHKKEQSKKKPEETKPAFKEIKKDIIDALDKIEKKSIKVEEKIEKKIRSPKLVIILKVLIILIPIIILTYILINNFLLSHDFVYNYDIGSQEDLSKNFLTPLNRVSEIQTEESSNINYRNLTSQLVYFNIPIVKDSESINIEMKYKDNFPSTGSLSLGGKDMEEWHYYSNMIYSSTIENLTEKYPHSSQGDYLLIQLNEDEPNYEINDFLTDTPLTKLSTNQNISIPEFSIPNYQQLDVEINTALRGTQVFYVYAKDNLAVYVEKRDLNWYPNNETGEDILEINLYDLDNKLISTSIIEDDGEKDKEVDKSSKNTQSKSFFVSDLKEGVYKLELKNNDDMLITNTKINQGKVVLVNKAFLAQSDVYFDNFEKDSILYFKTDSKKNTQLSVQTYHDAALQTVYVDGKPLQIKEKNKLAIINLPSSNDIYEFNSPKNDIIVKGPKYFSFTRESYFDPFPSGKVPFKEDVTYLENNADFVLVKYIPSTNQDNSWKISLTNFNIKEDNLFITNNQLNMLINTPHLNEKNNKTNTKQISIDYIKVTIHKPGLLEKWKNNKEESNA